MNINPTAMLKVVAALAPIMGNKELGEAMVREIQALFSSMAQSAQFMQQVDMRLGAIEPMIRAMHEKMLRAGMPLADGEVELLAAADYTAEIARAVALQVTHNG